jgi:hypothetical protein
MPVMGVGQDLAKELAKIDSKLKKAVVDGVNVDDLLDERKIVMDQLELAGQAMLSRS